MRELSEIVECLEKIKEELQESCCSACEDSEAPSPSNLGSKENKVRQFVAKLTPKPKMKAAKLPKSKTPTGGAAKGMSDAEVQKGIDKLFGREK